jgi:hypothetical protein
MRLRRAGTLAPRLGHAYLFGMASGCRFIEGDVIEIRTRGEAIFCGKPVAVSGGSWCREHLSRVMVKPAAKVRREADEEA